MTDTPAGPGHGPASFPWAVSARLRPRGCSGRTVTTAEAGLARELRQRGRRRALLRVYIGLTDLQRGLHRLRSGVSPKRFFPKRKAQPPFTDTRHGAKRSESRPNDTPQAGAEGRDPVARAAGG